MLSKMLLKLSAKISVEAPYSIEYGEITGPLDNIESEIEVAIQEEINAYAFENIIEA